MATTLYRMGTGSGSSEPTGKLVVYGEVGSTCHVYNIDEGYELEQKVFNVDTVTYIVDAGVDYKVWMTKTVSGVDYKSNEKNTGAITLLRTEVKDLAYWKASIKVTVPSGATATIKCGTSESYTLTATATKEIHTKGTWTFSCTKDGVSAVTYKLDGTSSTTKSKSITTENSTTTVDFSASYGYLKVTTTSDFESDTDITLKNSAGSTVATKTSASNTYTFTVATAGSYIAYAVAKDTATYGTSPYPSNSMTAKLGSTVNGTIETMATLNLTIYSASDDTLTVKRANGTSLGTCATNSSGQGSMTISIAPSGETITFTSTVANAIDGSSNKYSKSIALTKTSTKVYVMPDDTYLWWGYGKDNINNNASIGSGYAVKTANFVNNYFLFDSTLSNVSAYGLKTTEKVASGKVVKALYDSTIVQSNLTSETEIFLYCAYNTADPNKYFGALNNTAISKFNVPAKVYALWAE